MSPLNETPIYAELVQEQAIRNHAPRPRKPLLKNGRKS